MATPPRGLSWPVATTSGASVVSGDQDVDALVEERGAVHEGDKARLVSAGQLIGIGNDGGDKGVRTVCRPEDDRRAHHLAPGTAMPGEQRTVLRGAADREP